MPTENLFSTNREPSLSGSEMLEKMINRKNAQRQNMMALAEAKKLSESTPDFTATMEAANMETEEKLRKDAALEAAYYNQGSKNIAKHQLQMRSRLTMEGMEFVRNKVLGEIIYESYWLDEPVKEATVEQISESIGEMLSYISETCKSSKVEESKQSKLLKNVNKVIENTVKEAVNRLVMEAEETNDAFTEFELTDEEESKLDDKLADLGKDEIVEIVKNKVAKVIQDERERGKEKSELFTDIDKTINQTDEPEEDNTSEDDTEDAEESAFGDIDGDITMEGKITVREAFALESTVNYTASERRIASILESGAEFNVFEDPSWTEFKNYVSLVVKKIQNTLMTGHFNCSIALIDELEKRLSDVPETVPGDVKDFVLSMVSSVYGAVPADEVIISRIGGTFGSPGMVNNSSVSTIATSWMDVLVNIKTNLGSIKDYCLNKVSTAQIEDNCCKVQESAKTLDYMIAQKKNRMINRNMCSTMFEALMLSNLSNTDRAVTESNSPVSEEDVEDAALIESLLQYTILETLDTLGIYKFRLNDINTMKRDCMRSISEGTQPVYGKSDKNTVSMGSDNTGKKVVRINTQKMKRKTMKPSEES